MKNYFFAALVTFFLILTHIGVTDMKALTDKEMNSVTGQAGIVGFEQVFSQAAEVDQKIQKKVFDQVFVKNDLNSPATTQNQTTFEEAFVNRLGVDYTESTTQKLDMNLHADEITFAQAFSKATGVDADLGKTVLNDVKIKNLNIKVRGDVKIKFN